MFRVSRSGLLFGTALHGTLAALVLPSHPAFADPRPDPGALPAPAPPARVASVELPSAPAWRRLDMVVPTRVRAADHPGYSRVVFDFASAPAFAVTREGNRVVARFSGGGVSAIPGLAAKLRYVEGVEGGQGWGAVEVAHGAQVRVAKLDTRIVIDVMPPSGISLPAPAASNTQNVVAQAPAARPPAETAAPSSATAAPAAATSPVAPLPAATLPVASASDTVAPPPRARPAAPPRPARALAKAAPADARAAPPPVPPLAAAPAAKPEPGADRVPRAAPVQPVVADAPSPALPSPAMPPTQASAPSVAVAPPPLPVVPPDPPPPVAAAEPPTTAGTGHAVTLPFAATTGAAAFRRRGTAMVVFDEARPIDTAGLADDSIFGAATVQVLPGATVMQLKLDRDSVLRLTRVPSGWNVSVMPGPDPLTPIAPLPVQGSVLLPVAQPGQVVMVPDPDTGWNLLVGTQLRTGQGMAVARRSPAYVLSPTWQGVVVEPRSDRLGMRPVADGFLLSAPGLDLDVPSVRPEAQVLANAAGLTRRYDFPDMPDTVLLRRMNQFVDSAAALPPLARYQPRRDAAQSMIALGLGAEAQALLRLAVTDDPQHAGDPDLHGLAAIAALLADRDDEADGLDDPALTGTDEIALWRAVRMARKQEGSPAAAPVFAATLPLLLSYPDALRQRLLPLAMETMALGGATDVAAALLAKPEAAASGADLRFAAGLVAQVHGDTDGALGIFDELSGSPDQKLAARARRRAVELRLSSGRIGPAEAAAALSRQFMAWRADGVELSLRLRAAALYAQAGSWRPSIELLHETMGMYTDERPAIRRQMAQTFIAMLRDASAKDAEGKGGKISSLDLVTLADENPDLIPPGPDGDTLAGLLADRLLALDLPRRAAPVLEKLMRGAPTGSARAALGARLAELKLADGDGPATLVTLSDSAADDLPAPLAETRALLAARATARMGDTPKALGLLTGLATPAADELRAQLLTDAKDWHGAQAALADLASLTLPADGPFSDEQQNLVLRLAGAAGQAGDEAALRDMATRYGPRMANKQLSDMFRLLTAGPVSSMGDMPKVAGDIARARALPASLSAIKPN